MYRTPAKGLKESSFEKWSRGVAPSPGQPRTLEMKTGAFRFDPQTGRAESMAASDTLQAETRSEFLGETDSDPGSASEVLLYRPERVAPRPEPMRERIPTE